MMFELFLFAGDSVLLTSAGLAARNPHLHSVWPKKGFRNSQENAERKEADTDSQEKTRQTEPPPRKGATPRKPPCKRKCLLHVTSLPCESQIPFGSPTPRFIVMAVATENAVCFSIVRLAKRNDDGL